MMTKKQLGNQIASLSVPQVELLSEANFVDEFVKEHMRKIVKKKPDGTINDDSWIIDPKDNKKIIKRPDGYFQALTDEKSTHYKTIETFLIKWLITNVDELKRKHIITDKTIQNSKEQVLVSGDFKEMENNEILHAT